MAERSQLRLEDCRRPSVLLASGLGIGLIGRAPGTLGTLLALPVWWFLLAPLPPLVYGLVLLAIVAAGTALTAAATRHTGIADDQAIVIDEMAGVWLALALAPHSVWALAAGFLLFRLFDILKPWPVSWAERRLPGAWGVMADDLVAGAIALAILQVGILLLF
jgi:phosphatidylglycerophosphatase A